MQMGTATVCIVVLLLLVMTQSVLALEQAREEGVEILSKQLQVSASAILARQATVSRLDDGSVNITFTGPANSVWWTKDIITTWDWSGYGFIAIDLENPVSADVPLTIRLTDHTGSVLQGTVVVPAGEKGYVALPLDPVGSYGMWGLPTGSWPFWVDNLRNQYIRDKSRINRIEFSARALNPAQAEIVYDKANQVLAVQQPASAAVSESHVSGDQAHQVSVVTQSSSAQTVIVHGMRLLDAERFLTDIVDQFGQYSALDWPGKIQTVEDLIAADQKEAEQLRRWLAELDDTTYDRFGGYIHPGIDLEGTGYFRTEKVDGRWWLITPEGNLFYSLGFNQVGAPDLAPVSGREYMFQSLPEETSPLRPFYSWKPKGWLPDGMYINHYDANLYRKYGEQWRELSTQRTIERHLAWGFNTIGNASDARFFEQGLPFVVYITTHQNHPRTIQITDGKAVADVFAPNYELWMQQALRFARNYSLNPYVIGFFVDNEIAWGGWTTEPKLSESVLALGSDWDAKRVMVDRLQAKYSDISALNKAWGTGFASWDQLLQPTKLTHINPAAREDLFDFMLAFVDKYYATVKTVLKRLAPNHLYLGSRFAKPIIPEVVEVAARHADVVSVNVYDLRAFDAIWHSLDRPVIIGEWHFGAYDRGMLFEGIALPRTYTQRQRADAYVAYMREILSVPEIVGAHWYEYVDQPLVGRQDGENGQIGFVTITDIPHYELVEAARDINHSVYRLRLSGSEGNSTG